MDTPENKAETPRHSEYTRKQGRRTTTFRTQAKKAKRRTSGHTREQGEHIATFLTQQKTRRDTPISGHSSKQDGHTATFRTYQKTRRSHRDILNTPENKPDTPRHTEHTRKQDRNTAAVLTHQNVAVCAEYIYSPLNAVMQNSARFSANL